MTMVKSVVGATTMKFLSHLPPDAAKSTSFITRPQLHTSPLQRIQHVIDNSRVLEVDACQLLRHSAATAADNTPTENALYDQDQYVQDHVLEFEQCHLRKLAARQDEPAFFCLCAAMFFRLSSATPERLQWLFVYNIIGKCAPPRSLPSSC